MSLTDTASQAVSFDGRMHDLSAGRIRRAIRAARQIGILQLIALIRAHGLRRSFNFAAQNLRHIVAHRLALRWDERYGVDTAGSIQLHSLSVASPNKIFGNECVCTSPSSFDFMMRSLPRELSSYTFVDIGAGKSRPLLLASRYGFAKIIGVEFAKELVDCSNRNIARFKCEQQRCRAIEVVESDATHWSFPDDPLVIYFYNPFSREVFDVVFGNIVASLKSKKRNCYIVYGSSSHNAIEWAKPRILATGLFEEVPTDPMPLFFDAVRSVRFAVFRAG